jgi:hypothetical protein
MQSNEELDEMNSSEDEMVERSPVKSKAEMRRLKFKKIADYVMDALLPLVAVIAVIIAVMALNVAKSNRTEFGQSSSTLDHLNTNLKSLKSEVEKLKLALQQEKMLHAQLISKQEEQTRLLVQHVSKLQDKLKISPTLELLMLQAASTVVVQGAIPAAVAASQPVTATTITVQPAKTANTLGQVLKDAGDKLNKK